VANKGTWLTTGQYLSVGDYLVSDNGDYFIIMQSDGNFVLYRGSSPSDNHGSVWATNTNQAVNRVTGRSYLRSGEKLDVQDYLVSSNGLYFAVMQGDGSFVLYHTTGGANPTPDSNRPYGVVCSAQGYTIEQNMCFVTMQMNGNFVLYYRNDDIQDSLWATNTAQSAPGQYIAVLHDNGNFAIYSGSDPNQVSENTRLWQSNTALDPNALTVQILSGNNQNLKSTYVRTGQWTTCAPLVVQVKHQNGQPAPNMPVTFSLEGPSNAVFVQLPPGGWDSNITLNTNQFGVASLEQVSAEYDLSEGGGWFSIMAQTADSNVVWFTINITSS
jgi:hypothetical protein